MRRIQIIPILALTAATIVIGGRSASAVETSERDIVREASQVSIGGFACARLTSGQVLCWGRAGPATRKYNRPFIVQVKYTGAEKAEELTGVVQVSVGQWHACALVASGAQGGVYCWGANRSGQLGLGDARNRPVAERTQGLLGSEVAELAAGENHTCARMRDGVVLCWGTEAIGVALRQAGVPTAVTLPSPALEIEAGRRHTCARTRAGEIHCWGANSAGQLGNGKREASPIPVLVDSEPTRAFGAPISLSAGEDHTCAIFRREGAGGIPFCWGGNKYGQLGAATAGPDSAKPVRVLIAPEKSGAPSLPAAGAVAIAAGKHFTCGTFDGGRGTRLHCWGTNAKGQLGIRHFRDSRAAAPTQLLMEKAEVPGAAFARLATGEDFACAIGLDRFLRCWGTNEFGDLANVSAGSSYPAPVGVMRSIELLQDAVDLAAGSDFACAALKNEIAVCWGENRHGNLGSGSPGTSAVPRLVRFRDPSTLEATLLRGVKQVGAGNGHACAAVQPLQNAYCWGANDHGQLGDGTRTNQTSAVPVLRKDTGTRLDGVREVYAGGDASCAIVGDERALFCWGKLGFTQDHYETRAVPILDGMTPGPIAGIDAVRPGNSTCALRSGKVLCFGFNVHGNLGNGTYRPDPKVWDSGNEPGFNIDTYAYFDSPFYVMTRFNRTPWLGTAHPDHWWHRPGNLFQRTRNPWATTANDQLQGIVELGRGNGEHHCAVRGDRKVFCWGVQPGVHVAAQVPACSRRTVEGRCAAPPKSLQGVKLVTSGQSFSCAYGATELLCWGSNRFSRVSDSDRPEEEFAAPSEGLGSGENGEVMQLAGGGSSVCARFKTGRIGCWGRPLGNDTVSQEPIHRAALVLRGEAPAARRSTP